LCSERTAGQQLTVKLKAIFFEGQFALVKFVQVKNILRFAKSLRRRKEECWRE